MICLLALLAQTWEPLKLPEVASGKTLRGIAASDAQSLWIVGDQGLCLRSQDGGRAWKVNPLGTPATLRAIRFLNPKVGFAVGDGDPDAPKPAGHVVMGRRMTSGTVLWTLDGGQTWTRAHAPTNFEITCAEARPGGPVQLGNSGGEGHLDGDILRGAWEGKEFKGYRCYRALFDIRALDAKRWVSVGSPVSVGFTPPPTDPLYLQKECRALVSRDGGETWTPSKGSDGPGSLRGLFVGASRLLAVGDGGVVLSSEDKGETWKPLTSGCAQDLFAVASAGPTAVAVGDQETTLVSSDGGLTWKRTSSGASGAYLAVVAHGDGFIAVGENGMARRASTKALVAAKAVEPLAIPAKPEAKGPTKAQLERVRAGSVSVYEVDIQAPAMRMKLNFHREEEITAVSATSYTIEARVVKGTPPPGTPAKGTVEVAFENIVDFDAWKVGETRDESVKGQKIARARLADEKVQVGDRTLDCFVIELKVQTADGGTTVHSKNWFAKRDVPGLGVVKDETVQEMAGPQGKITVTQTVKLLSFRRGKTE